MSTESTPSRFASRKLLVCLIGMLLASFMRWRGLITDDQLVTVLVTGMLGYPAANVAQKALEKPGPRSEVTP